MRHFIIVGILVIIAAILTYAGLNAAHLMPVEASAQAIPIDWMWNWHVIAMSFLFALIVVPLVYSLIVFRRKKGDTSDAAHITGNTPLEITWTVIPLITVLVIAYLGAYTLGETRRVDPQAMIIKVHAQQFAWSFEYPEYGGFVSDELHLPRGRQVLLEMDSKDVIHSFWVPEFRVKQDVVPGRVTQIRITPTLNGTYKTRCSELCGSGHYSMEASVVVVDIPAFQQWASDQQAAAATASLSPEARGEMLAKTNGCFGCHTTNGAKLVGPSWQGLFGSQVELSDGSTVTADEAYIKEAILNPSAQIVAGFTPAMPPYTFSDDELADIIAYIKTLK